MQVAVAPAASRRHESRAAFEDLLYQEVTSGGKGEVLGRSEVGGGVRLSGLERDHRMGALQETGSPTHVAINGSAYMVLEDSYGERVYTRDGTLSIDGEGTLRHSSGLEMYGNINIPDETADLRIQEDGTVQVRLADDIDYTSIGNIEMVDFINPVGLRSLGSNAYAETPQSGDPLVVNDGSSAMIQYYLESSNVDVAEELINMITAQRSYELNSKVVQAADEAMQVAANLRR